MTAPPDTPPRDPIVEGPSASRPGGSRRGRWFRFGIFLAMVALAIVVGKWLGLGQYTQEAKLRETVEALRHLRWIAPGFVAAYTIGASIGLPATPFTFTGAALFGPVLGSLLNWLGATLGATGSFLLARVLGHGAMAHMIRRRVPDMHDLVAEHGFATVLRLRLIPVFPYNALNLGAGLAGMRLAPYFYATALGLIPAVILYSILGASVAEGAMGGGRSAYMRALVVGGVIVAVSFVPALVKRKGKRTG
jgi:uncharacterized membrane protein YdjX (TVP38/TMEM64 family)